MAQGTGGENSDRWSSLLSKLSPVPRFPEYTGPYKVGTVDVEIPVSELESPAPAPDNAVGIDTVSFRIFYPCEPNATGERIRWLPTPQREHLSAYIKFLGAGPLFAQAASYLPRHLHFTSIPVVSNAPILKPDTANKRWPTMIFSHGLGGSRNAYSQITGGLASHGVVVICPEHRDGSAIASFIRTPISQKGFFGRNTKREIPYARIPHNGSDEAHELRNDQLRIRLWEMGLIHEAILGIDRGQELTNLDKSTCPLGQFSDLLHVHQPGSIIFSGHSFGAATVVQFLKSVFYSGRPELEVMQTSLYAPNWESSICAQVTPQNVTILLDLWCFPLTATTTKPLFNLPLPVYAPTTPSSPDESPGTRAVLAVESEDFYKWRDHLHTTARILSPEPSSENAVVTNKPYLFYVKRSVHLSQSDFGLLFPFLTRMVFKSESPDRALRLNLRAQLQILRINGIPIAATQPADLVDDNNNNNNNNKPTKGDKDKEKDKDKDNASIRSIGINNKPSTTTTTPTTAATDDDTAILDREGNAVKLIESTTTITNTTNELIKAWRWIDVMALDRRESINSVTTTTKGSSSSSKKSELKRVDEEEPEMASVIEPGVSSPSSLPPTIFAVSDELRRGSVTGNAQDV
ncbi:phospholipase A2 [Poronia punctata]|nr:phospholipase A2 [Poronia punctata]